MNYNQNIRIAQVTESTLIVGVDIGSAIHFARHLAGVELSLVKYLSLVIQEKALYHLKNGFNYCKNGTECVRVSCRGRGHQTF